MITYYCDICNQPVKIWYELNREAHRRPDIVGIPIVGVPADAIHMTNRSRMICCDCADKIEAFIIDLQREATANE